METECSKTRFTMIELMIVIAIITILAGLLLPSLINSRKMAQATHCKNSVKQLLTANFLYESNWNSFAPWGFDRKGANLHRWHGTRSSASKSAEYEVAQGLLNKGADLHCPSMTGLVDRSLPAEERGGGGFGYNIYIGTKKYLVDNPDSVEAYSSAVSGSDIGSPDETIMFTDTASIVSDALAEHSICVAPFGVSAKQTDSNISDAPSIHFRHAGRANIGWCDGHVDSRKNEWTLNTKYRDSNLGFLGPRNDNGFFDLD